jgi:hypothetical protein
MTPCNTHVNKQHTFYTLHATVFKLLMEASILVCLVHTRRSCWHVKLRKLQLPWIGEIAIVLDTGQQEQQVTCVRVHLRHEYRIIIAPCFRATISNVFSHLPLQSGLNIMVVEARHSGNPIRHRQAPFRRRGGCWIDQRHLELCPHQRPRRAHRSHSGASLGLCRAIRHCQGAHQGRWASRYQEAHSGSASSLPV